MAEPERGSGGRVNHSGPEDIDPGAGRECPDFETASEGYAARFGGAVGELFLEKQAGTIEGALDRLGGVRTVLDVGGGHDQTASTLATWGYRVTVLASSPAAFRNPGSDSCPYEREVGDLLDLPFPDDAFDVAMSLRTLPHLSGWRRLIAELCRVSRRAVILDYPTGRSANAFGRLFFPLKRRIEKNTRPYSLFSSAEIALEFARSQYEVTESHAQFFFPMVLHRLLGSAPLTTGLETLPRRIGLTRILGSPVIAVAIRRRP